jgi:hypothetical protein
MRDPKISMPSRGRSIAACRATREPHVMRKMGGGGGRRRRLAVAAARGQISLFSPPFLLFSSSPA